MRKKSSDTIAVIFDAYCDIILVPVSYDLMRYFISMFYRDCLIDFIVLNQLWL